MADSGWWALGGVAVGTVLSTISSTWIESWRDRRQSERIAKAIAGEITADLKLIRRRKYLEGVRQIESECRQTGNIHIFSAHINEDYLPVLRASITQVGTLKGNLPSLIPEVLTMAKSMFEDIKRIGSGEDMFGSNAIAAAEFYKELGDLMEDAFKAAENVVAEIRRLYG